MSRAPRRAVTIQDVAVRAGVSPATVSRVLNGNRSVAPELAERVREAARTLAYRPSGVARNLRRRRTSVVGLVISDIRNPFFTDVVRGIEDRLSRDGRSLVLCNSDEDPRKEAAYLELAVDERMSGLIVSPASSAETRVDLPLRAGIPVVAIDREIERAPVDTVLVDNVRGAELATSHLLAAGYRRVACVTGPASTTTGAARLAGWRLALERAGRTPDPALVRRSTFKEEGGYAAAGELLALAEPPDAFFVANNLMAVGVLAALAERGLEVPSEVGVVGFDETPWARLLRPPLTTVEQPTYALGQAAAELLTSRIAGTAGGPRRVVLEPRLVVRASASGRGLGGSSDVRPTRRQAPVRRDCR